MSNKKYDWQDVIDVFAKTHYELISTESDYINCTKPTLMYYCPIHRDKGILKTSLAHMKEGKGCWFCGQEKSAMHRQIPLDKDFHRKLCDDRGYIYVDSVRERGKIYIMFVCCKHKDLGTQKMTVNNMKRNRGNCQYCIGRNLPKWYVIQKVNTISPHLRPLEPFDKISIRQMWHCDKHHIDFHTSYQDVLNGKGCVECGKEKLSKQHWLEDQDIQQRINVHNPHVILIKYNGMQNASECYCNIHNRTFKKWIQTLSNGNSGCEECYTDYIRKTQGLGEDEFLKRLKKIHPELVAIDHYINNSTPIKFYCTIHDYFFNSTPVAVLNRSRCCEKTRVSHKEEMVCRLLESWCYRIQRQKTFVDCIDKRCLPFDIYLIDFNILIEFQGEQHYYPLSFGGTQKEALFSFEYNQKHDKIKKSFCKRNKIPLIYIPYWEYDNLEYFLFDQLVKFNALIKL